MFVLDAPTSIAIIPSPITVNEGQTVTATCTAQGSPTITYTWFKDNTNSQLSTGSILQITSSTRTDAGTYLCRASNAYGNADAAVTLDVQCKYRFTRLFTNRKQISKQLSFGN